MNVKAMAGKRVKSLDLVNGLLAIIMAVRDSCLLVIRNSAVVQMEPGNMKFYRAMRCHGAQAQASDDFTFIHCWTVRS